MSVDGEGRGRSVQTGSRVKKRGSRGRQQEVRIRARPAPARDLLRLRGATAAYVAILRAMLPAVEATAAYADPPELVLTPEVATPVHDLAEAVRAAVEVDDAPGTPATIERLLAVVLGGATAAAGSPA